MSHFTVLVIGDDPEEQLAPYQENNMGDCPKEYMEFHDMEDELREEYETETIRMYKSPEGELFLPWDKKFKVDGSGSSEKPDNYEEVEVPVKERYDSFDAFVKDWHGYKKQRVNGERRYGYWENPEARWDWYQLGGRWSGFFMLKPEHEDGGTLGEPGAFGRSKKLHPLQVDQAYKDEIDWEAVAAMNREGAERAYEEAMQSDNEHHRGWMYGIKPGDTKESYIARRAKPSTFAVLHGGNWYEQGSMGWWGIVSDEKDEDEWVEHWNSLVDSLPGDTLLSVYDCHI